MNYSIRSSEGQKLRMSVCQKVRRSDFFFFVVSGVKNNFLTHHPPTIELTTQENHTFVKTLKKCIFIFCVIHQLSSKRGDYASLYFSLSGVSQQFQVLP